MDGNSIKRPNYAIAKAAHERWEAANARYLEATAADRNLIDQHRLGEDADRDLLQAASHRIGIAQSELREQTQSEQTILDEWRLIRKAGNELIESRGTRYAEKTLDNFVVTCEAQEKVIQALRDYAEQSAELIPIGKNVILTGPSGGGKDHLLLGLAKEVLRCSGHTTRWVNGVELHKRFRESVTGASFTLISDPDREANVLWISDPLPPSGVLSEFQQAAMFSLIDSRYSNLKPVWITLNVADAEEAERRMGVQVVDRLRDDALVLFCNWPSYRQSH